jgi:hypothetical protein
LAGASLFCAPRRDAAASLIKTAISDPRAALFPRDLKNGESPLFFESFYGGQPIELLSERAVTKLPPTERRAACQH